MYYTDKGYYPTNSQVTNLDCATANMVGVNKSMYNTSLAGTSVAFISRDPVTSALNDAANYFQSGYINYRASSSYWLNADGTFNDNDTSCNSGTSCPIYVLVYRLSNGTLVYSYGT